MWDFLTAVGGTLLVIALPYFLLMLLGGVLAIRKAAGSLRAQESDVGGGRVPEGSYTTYFLIPCLNEALVIGQSIERLTAEVADGLIVVIDDGSEDGTADVARAAADRVGAGERLLVVERTLPMARLGKGEALNHAFSVVSADVRERGLDPRKVILCVLDADGQLSPGVANRALTAFEDERVGGVQLIVRIRNRDRWLTQMQDVEFWCISATAQFARTYTGTVSLGGNGQFTRLAALRDLEGEVWSQSLTEDLDLGLRLYAAGWTVTTPPFGFVDQQGVTKLRPLLRQRTRWYQGHMTSISRVPELVRSRHLSEGPLLEAILYLLVPWVIVLPWSIIQQLVIIAPLLEPDRWFAGAFDENWLVASITWVFWYVLSFLPNVLIGVTYARRTSKVSFLQALLLGHMMIPYNYVGYAAAWIALFRIITGRRGWSKTPRSTEAPVSTPAAGRLSGESDSPRPGGDGDAPRGDQTCPGRPRSPRPQPLPRGHRGHRTAPRHARPDA